MNDAADLKSEKTKDRSERLTNIILNTVRVIIELFARSIRRSIIVVIVL
jgi:hypothetical protein